MIATCCDVIRVAGDLINMKCDSVVCPNPPVPDCYMNEAICAEDEWCQLEDQGDRQKYHVTCQYSDDMLLVFSIKTA
jgi:hypothetical protein